MFFTTQDLKEHISATYFSLRIVMAILAISLPFVLWIVGNVRADLPLQHSMSAYYHAGGGAVRDIFVGFLFSLGVSLYLYKGFTGFENWALNLAGISVIVVALKPIAWECGNSCSKFSWHGVFAVLFFLFVAYVTIFRASDTLSLISEETRKNSYRIWYKWMGWAMVIFPVIAVFFGYVLQPHSEHRSKLFFIEALGVIVFALYWIVKSFEIRQSNCHGSALEGRLRLQYRLADMFKPLSVERIEPSTK